MKHVFWLWAICWLCLATDLQAQRLANQYTFGYNQVFPFDMIGQNHVVWASYKHYLKKGFFVGLRADYHLEENNYTLRALPLEPDWYLLSVEERFALAGAVSHDDLDAGIRQFETRDWRDTDIYANLTTGYTFVFWRERLNLSLFGGIGVTYKQTSGVVSSSSNYVITDPTLPQVEGSILYPGYKRGLTPSPLAGFEFAYQVKAWLLGINAVFNPRATTIITHGLLVGRQF